MAQRVKNRKTDIENPSLGDIENESNVAPRDGSSKVVFIFVGLLLFIGGALYVERSVLMPPPQPLESVQQIKQPATPEDVQHIHPHPAQPVEEQIKQPATPVNVQHIHPHPAQPVEEQRKQPATVEDVQHMHPHPAQPVEEQIKQHAIPVKHDPAVSAPVNYEELESQVKDQIAVVSDMKKKQHLIMETDAVAIEATRTLQELCRKLVPLKYGPEPYLLEIKLKFPFTMPDYETKGADGTIQIEMAPIEFMPYSVLTFLDMVVHEWKGGAFHRNAGHVKQATVQGQHKGFPLVYQEYSSNFPHVKYSLGFAGRPSSSAFYISTMNNVNNHGPGSQGSATEADACFAKLVGGDSKSGASVEVVKRMDGQPGGTKPNGFVSPASNHIAIESFKLIR